MLYQKIIKLLDNTPNQSSKFRIHQCLSQVCVFNYSDECLLKKLTMAPVTTPLANSSNNNKGVVFENSAPFTDWISKLNNTQIENVKDIDVVMPIYNLIK